MLILFLTIDSMVEIWSSLFPRLPSLPSSEASELVASVDMAVEGKYSFQTPSKKQHATGKISLDLNDLSFAADNIAVTQDLDGLLPLIYSHVNALNTATEQLCQGFTSSSSSIFEDVSKIHLDLSLLRDNLGSDPGLTYFPLRSAWERIAFTKDALIELSVKIMSVLQNYQPLFRLITSRL